MAYEPTSLGQITEWLYRTHVTDAAARLGIRERDLAAHVALHGPVDIHPLTHNLWTGRAAA